MSALLTVKWDHRITLNGEEYVMSSPSTPPTRTLSSLDKYTDTIAAGTTKQIWNPVASNQPLAPSAFDYLYALASVAMFLELTCNDGDANERVFAVPLAAGFPFALYADDAFYNFTAGPAGDAFAGTLDVIDHVRIKNAGASDGLLTWAIGKS